MIISKAELRQKVLKHISRDKTKQLHIYVILIHISLHIYLNVLFYFENIENFNQIIKLFTILQIFGIFKDKTSMNLFVEKFKISISLRISVNLIFCY